MNMLPCEPILWRFWWCLSFALWAVIIWIVLLEDMNVISVRTHGASLLGLVAYNKMFQAFLMFVPFFVAICTLKYSVYVLTHL